jgi:hypothetical protein
VLAALSPFISVVDVAKGPALPAPPPPLDRLAPPPPPAMTMALAWDSVD